MKDMEKYMKGLKALLDQYTLPTDGAILNFLTTSQTAGPGPEGYLTTAGSNVVQPGDTLTIWTWAATRQTARVSVNTTYQSSAVQLTATFRTLPSGLNYMNYATIDVPASRAKLRLRSELNVAQQADRLRDCATLKQLLIRHVEESLGCATKRGLASAHVPWGRRDKLGGH